MAYHITAEVNIGYELGEPGVPTLVELRDTLDRLVRSGQLHPDARVRRFDAEYSSLTLVGPTAALGIKDLITKREVWAVRGPIRPNTLDSDDLPLDIVLKPEEGETVEGTLTAIRPMENKDHEHPYGVVFTVDGEEITIPRGYMGRVTVKWENIPEDEGDDQ